MKNIIDIDLTVTNDSQFSLSLYTNYKPHFSLITGIRKKVKI